mgnify:FL=1
MHPAAMQILVKCLGAERVCLITDAMPGAGLPDGQYTLLNQDVQVTQGIARLADGTLAGSTATMDQCLRNMAGLCGVSLAQAAHMAATTPARVLGMDSRLGALLPGKQADIVLLSQDLQVKMTIKNGKVIYKE